MRRIPESLRALALIAGFALATAPVRAQNPCADGGSPFPTRHAPAGGIGGTGRSADGIGGTGIQQEGIGGTGIDGGIGGTGHGAPRPEGGIGGTAISAADRPSQGGIGGTGISDRAVIGVVTGFASICVGGIEIEYDGTTPIRVDGHPASEQALEIGRVVQVTTSGDGDRLQAASVRVDHLVVGPVDSVTSDLQELRISGQFVRITDETVFGADVSPATLSDPHDGLFAVEGLRRDDGVIIASRISRSDSGQGRLVGVVDAVAGKRLVVAGTRVALGEETDIAEGDLVVVSGRTHGGRLIDAHVGRYEPIASPDVRRVDVESYLSDPRGRDVLRLGGRELRLSETARVDLQGVSANDRVRIAASRLSDGSWRAERVIPVRPVMRPKQGDVGSRNYVPRANESADPKVQAGGATTSSAPGNPRPPRGHDAPPPAEAGGRRPPPPPVRGGGRPAGGNVRPPAGAPGVRPPRQGLPPPPPRPPRRPPMPGR